jgi:hypothetical protein
MLPVLVLAWETAATARAAVEESVQAPLSPIGAPALLSGGELSGDARAAGKRSTYEIFARARYGRALTLAAGGAPDDSVDAEGSTSATWTLGPLATLALTGQTALATTWGVRTESLLPSPDPFLDARRLEYSFGGDLTWSFTPSPRMETTLDGGYAQEGALASDVEGTVGADSREAHLGIAHSFDVAPRISISPEIRYSFTRYEHALLDVERHRGRALVHGVTLSLGGARELTPHLRLTGSLGVTVASPMPIADTDAPVIAPEAALGLRYRGRRADLTARWASSYTSLGPRIGQGYQHGATLKVTAWPFAARSARGAVLRGQVRATHGAAPIGADPPPPMPGLPPPPSTATLVTTKVAARATLEIPIARGWAVTTGLDLAFSRGRMSPAPAGSEPRTALTGMLTLGLARTWSTDNRRLFPPAPGEDRDIEGRRAARGDAGARSEDRTRIDVGRSAEE